ncbi:peptidase M50 [Candidatus Termititenax persephonae]|uniref:Peptidase M50 n=1 Tax=Candidatus Termititenax persephonae TaxID=2218525 RepID=A0A388THQ6_9BACT|nr:peptidase M50 [Candidatus Termititenax persephonae]
MRVVSFNIGFGARLCAVRRGQTLYALRCIPFGGYVQLADDSKTAPDVPPAELFENKSWLARFGIVSGGALFNILFAWAVFYGLYLAASQTAFYVAFYKSFLAFGWLLKEFLREIILLFVQGNYGTVSGPLGVLSFSAQSLRYGLAGFWQAAALLSVNLGIINLLPFPALDGGRLLFLFYELLFRRKPNPQWENRAHLGGFLLLMVLLIFLSFRDLLRLAG